MGTTNGRGGKSGGSDLSGGGIPGLILGELRVLRKEPVTPRYLRVVLGGEAVAEFAHLTVGVNNKLFIPPPGVRRVHFPTFDPERGARIPAPEAVRPVIRTFTHRSHDPERGEMSVDFVLHGEEGPASRWALHAREGDPIGVAMKDRTAPLHPPATRVLLGGDATAIPMIGALLEGLPAEAAGIVWLEVEGSEEEQELVAPRGVAVRWVHGRAGSGELPARMEEGWREMAREGEEVPLVHFAGEYADARSVRAFFREGRGIERGRLHVSAYWKRGSTEEDSAAVRRSAREDRAEGESGPGPGAGRDPHG